VSKQKLFDKKWLMLLVELLMEAEVETVEVDMVEVEVEAEAGMVVVTAVVMEAMTVMAMDQRMRNKKRRTIIMPTIMGPPQDILETMPIKNPLLTSTKTLPKILLLKHQADMNQKKKRKSMSNQLIQKNHLKRLLINYQDQERRGKKRLNKSNQHQIRKLQLPNPQQAIIIR